VPNLNIVDENHTYVLAEGVHLAGIGGNCAVSRLFSQDPFVAGGKIAIHADHLRKLKAAWDLLGPDTYRIFLTHVSPARYLMIQLYVAQLGPNLCISGHMGPPRAVSYSHYALTDRASLDRLWEQQLNNDEDLCRELRKRPEFADMLGIVCRTDRLEISWEKYPSFMRMTWFLNLPDSKRTDSKRGYAIWDLDTEHETENLCLISRGRLT